MRSQLNSGGRRSMRRWRRTSLNQTSILSCPSHETLFSRLKKRALKDNRLDDANDQVIQRRLDTYETESKPVLAHYPQELITVVDATQPPAKVLLEILESVNDGVYEPAAV